MTTALQIATEANTTDASRLRESPFAIRGLTVSYDQKPAVFSVDATFERGAMTAIVGPNGAGKSTLLKAALGIIKPLSGQVTVFGHSATDDQSINFFFHNFWIFYGLNFT